ncbi:hypothetical protein FACS1894195_0450 [Bacteroidia bacterium]|nr:hypothetical protein FACS1894195_0450 [Bacteroidia bacterium]
MKTRKKIFISVPITGRTIEDVESDIIFASGRLEKILGSDNIEIINPLELCSDIPEGSKIGVYIGRCVQTIIDDADAVYFCRDCYKSDGCRVEMVVAEFYEKKYLSYPMTEKAIANRFKI